MICRTPNDDPCSRLTSPAEAIECADALLSSSAVPGSEFWAAAAVGPLAAVLYAASPRGNREGIRWVTQAVAAIPDDAPADSAQARAARRWSPSWDSAIAYLGGQAHLSSALQRARELRPRQRDSIVMTMREALSPWTERREIGE